jgi:hypothetical protein
MKLFKYIKIVAFLILLVPTFNKCDDSFLNVEWTVVGAGPAGIAVVGILLDSGVLPQQIMWIDPTFNVGRLGQYYSNVPGNARVQQYIDFLKACKSFSECKSTAIDYLFNLPPNQTPELKFIVDPLIDITDYLRMQVQSSVDQLTGLDFNNNQWLVSTKNTAFNSNRVVLATGAHPRQIQYKGIPQIPLDLALDKSKLATFINPDDSVGVVGSAHSALLIVKYLTELPVKFIYNFYRKPIVFPIPVNGGIAWQEAGIKGELAKWLQNSFIPNPPKNVWRIFNTDDALNTWLPKCSKVIFACGFDRNELPPVQGTNIDYSNYDNATGVIGPRLFGVGIAFPEKKVDPLGNVEYLVGLPFFMPYIQKIVPDWMKKKLNRSLYSFSDLFTIKMLY